jgi:hypothetical protein
MRLNRKNGRSGTATGVEIATGVEAEAEAAAKIGLESRHPRWIHWALAMFEGTATGEEQSGREKGGRHQISAGRWRSRQSYYRGGGRESDAARYHWHHQGSELVISQGAVVMHHSREWNVDIHATLHCAVHASTHLRAYDLPHTAQTNGRSFVWRRIWRRRCSNLAKGCWQMWHFRSAAACERDS